MNNKAADTERSMRQLREYCTSHRDKYAAALHKSSTESGTAEIAEANNEIIDIIMRGANGSLHDAITICMLLSVTTIVKKIVVNDLEFMQHDHISNSMLQTIMYSRETADDFYKLFDTCANSKETLCKKLRDAGHICGLVDVKNMLQILAEMEFINSRNKTFGGATDLYRKWDGAARADDALNVFRSRCSVHRRSHRATILKQFPPIIARKVIGTLPGGQKRSADKTECSDREYVLSEITPLQYNNLMQEINDMKNDKRQIVESVAIQESIIAKQGELIKSQSNLISSIDASGKITYDRVKKLTHRLDQTMDDVSSLYSKISVMKDQMMEMAHINNLLLSKIME